MRIALAAFACLALAGCVTATTNPQSPTATEELLPGHAARAAAAEVNLVCRTGHDHCVPAHSRVFVRVRAGDESREGRIAAAEVAEHLSPSLDLVDDVAKADVVVDLTVIAAGIDDVDHVIGLPSMSIPAVPGHTASTTQTPEVSLVGWHDRLGIVEIEADARDARTGRFITAVGPLSAVAQLRRGSVLTGISWGRVLEPPAISVQRR